MQSIWFASELKMLPETGQHPDYTAVFTSKVEEKINNQAYFKKIYEKSQKVSVKK